MCEDTVIRLGGKDSVIKRFRLGSHVDVDDNIVLCLSRFSSGQRCELSAADRFDES